MKEHRNRRKIKMTATRPVLMVNRSNKHLYAQIIDNQSGKVLASASDIDVKAKKGVAGKVGEIVAKRALEAKVKKIVFDRSPYPYQGKIKQLAEGARKAGLEF